MISNSRIKSSTNGQLYAALDLGSNSFHMLVGRFDDDNLVIVDRYKETVRMASGLDRTGALTASMIRRALVSLSRLTERIRSFEPEAICVVGTNTLRVAKNSDEFLEQAEMILGAPIHIVGGIEEARLIYQGICCDVVPKGKRLVIDIGGGSTECVLGEKNPLLLDSINIGCVSLFDQYFAEGNLSYILYQHALLAVQTELQGVGKLYQDIGWIEVVGASGCIRAIEKALDQLGFINHHRITPESLERLIQVVFRYDHVEQLQELNLDLDRDHLYLLPAGLAILQPLFTEFELGYMDVSSYALREGLLYEMARTSHEYNAREATVQRLMQQYSVDVDQAKRVEKMALHLLDQVNNDLQTPYEMARRLLIWAARLHEIGLAISRDRYHEHSAYIIEHGDLPGFSRSQQKLLSFLVLNYRRKFHVLPKSYGFDPDWRLIQLFRLACLFCRRRDDNLLPIDVWLTFAGEKCKVSLTKDWLDRHPLTRENLTQEVAYLRGQNLKLQISRR